MSLNLKLCECYMNKLNINNFDICDKSILYDIKLLFLDFLVTNVISSSNSFIDNDEKSEYLEYKYPEYFDNFNLGEIYFINDLPTVFKKYDNYTKSNFIYLNEKFYLGHSQYFLSVYKDVDNKYKIRDHNTTKNHNIKDNIILQNTCDFLKFNENIPCFRHFKKIIENYNTNDYCKICFYLVISRLLKNTLYIPSGQEKFTNLFELLCKKNCNLFPKIMSTVSLFNENDYVTIKIIFEDTRKIQLLYSIVNFEDITNNKKILLVLSSKKKNKSKEKQIFRCSVFDNGTIIDLKNFRKEFIENLHEEITLLKNHLKEIDIKNDVDVDHIIKNIFDDTETSKRFVDKLNDKRKEYLNFETEINSVKTKKKRFIPFNFYGIVGGNNRSKKKWKVSRR